MSEKSTHDQDREFPRRYVRSDDAFGTWSAAEPYYRELSERPINSAAEFERWLTDFSELDSVFNEEETRRNVEYTCATSDEGRKQRYLDFVQNVAPNREPCHDELRRKLVSLADRFPLPPKRYEVLLRSVRNSIELFREENIPLQVEEMTLIQQHQEITGAMTVEYGGKELTLQQLGRFLEETDRSVREETWRLGAQRHLDDAPKLDALYENMVQLRHKMARNAGFDDYCGFAFRGKERFDYTPADCVAFHNAIAEIVTPAAGVLASERRERLGVETLRPWDGEVDPDGRPPLRPFETDAELVAGCSTVFNAVEPELGDVFDTLHKRNMLDLGSRKGKAPGGYQATFEEQRTPFIFMNAVGTERDVRTLLHEGGHAFHTWACRNDPLLAYRGYPIEFAEVASMGMELLALRHLETFYGDELNRAKKRFLEGIIGVFPHIARVDALQHYVYKNVDCGVEARKDEWVRLSSCFAPHTDWTGLDQFQRHGWHRQLHFFQVPLYYIEYGIAQVGALQVWLNSKKDYQQAVAMYRNGLALGGSRPLPELFEAAGCKFDFTAATLRPLIDAVMEEIAKL